MSAALRYVFVSVLVFCLCEDVLFAQGRRPSEELQEKVLDSVGGDKDADVHSYKRDVLNLNDNSANVYDEVKEDVPENGGRIPQIKGATDSQYFRDSYTYNEETTVVENNSYLETEEAPQPRVHPETAQVSYINDYDDNEGYDKEEEKAVSVATVVVLPAILRTAPSRESGRIYALPLGQNLIVRLRRGNWYQVDAGGIHAWLPKDVLEITNFD